MSTLLHVGRYVQLWEICCKTQLAYLQYCGSVLAHSSKLSLESYVRELMMDFSFQKSSVHFLVDSSQETLVLSRKVSSPLDKAMQAPSVPWVGLALGSRLLLIHLLPKFTWLVNWIRLSCSISWYITLFIFPSMMSQYVCHILWIIKAKIMQAEALARFPTTV